MRTGSLPLVRTFLLVLHVLGAIIALGFSLSYGLWVRRGEADGVQGRAFALRTISWIDRRVTTPAFIAQLITGLLLVATLDWDLLRRAWLEVSLAIYVLLTALAIVDAAIEFELERVAPDHALCLIAHHESASLERSIDRLRGRAARPDRDRRHGHQQHGDGSEVGNTSRARSVYDGNSGDVCRNLRWWDVERRRGRLRQLLRR